MSKMTCPICSKEFDDLEYGILDNGNPVCADCARKEDKKQEEKL